MLLIYIIYDSTVLYHALSKEQKRFWLQCNQHNRNAWNANSSPVQYFTVDAHCGAAVASSRPQLRKR